MEAFGYALGDTDFYTPLSHSTGQGTLYEPSRPPGDWRCAVSGVWKQWLAKEGPGIADQGWKVHVSARAERAAEVLDTVSAICFDEGVGFKHLRSSLAFVVLHHKHASRSQSGKFIAAYPPDEDTARRLMERLAAALDDEEGPYVLTDRPFAGSKVVYYRYGAFVPQGHVRPDGSTESTVKDGYGNEVPDDRRVGFHLPAGITDPFEEPRPQGAAAASPVIHGYRFVRVIRFSNSGGTYEAVQESTGRKVFIKEARPHSGLVSTHSDARGRLECEYRALIHLHAVCPGLGPQPFELFEEGGHDFLVTEFIEGTPLQRWCVTRNPVVNSRPTAREFLDYHADCLRIVAGLEQDLADLHEVGYAFIDLGPDNVMVSEDGSPRLVDFETAGPVGGTTTPIGAPGFFVAELAARDPRAQDLHALASIALHLLAPVNLTADRNPAVLGHLRLMLNEFSPVPPVLWDKAMNRTVPAPAGQARAASAQEVARDPLGHLTALREELLRGILEAALPQGDGPLFPPVPESFATNDLSVEHGAAGVIHVLQRVGAPVPGPVMSRFVREAMDRRDQLPPGLLSGLAGIAWVLAGAGLLDEARESLDLADRHPLLPECGNLAHGRAGLAMTHLRLYGLTGEDHHLERARALEPSAARTGIGLLTGRAGAALVHYYLARLTGDPDHVRRGLDLLLAEAANGVEDHGGLLFRPSTDDRRLMPYLGSGSAGVGLVVDRYRQVADDDRLTDLAAGIRTAVSVPFTRYGGLLLGGAGLGAYLADLAARHDDPSYALDAQAAAVKLFLHAVPTDRGTYLLGGPGLRLSCDLGTGSAGALLFLDQLLNRRRDALFTLDELTDPRPSGEPAATPPATSPAHT